jgi:hypothetical protein
MVMDDSFRVKEKSFAATIVRTTGMETADEPLAPVSIAVYIPGVALLATVRLAVTEPSPGAAITDLENDPVIPVGRLQESVTGELKLPTWTDVTLIGVVVPVLTVRADWAGVSMNPAAVTITGIWVVAEKPSPLAVRPRLKLVAFIVEAAVS